ncbi:MAG: multicopper oxidase family protein, partial [Planctomycetota bacterium]
AVSNFTLAVAPGQTADAIFEWTGAQLGWDIYGHEVNDPLQPNEYAPDHGKPFPVTLPDAKNLTFGASYSGSPFLGLQGDLPPGQGGFNVNAGYFYMWHSHNEKEMVNYDIFPGGMMTMLIVEPHGVTIE